MSGMKLTLHHINLSTQNVEQMNGFYRGVLGLTEESAGLPTLEKNKGYSGDVAFVSDGHIQMHLAQKDVWPDSGLGISSTRYLMGISHIAPMIWTLLKPILRRRACSIQIGAMPLLPDGGRFFSMIQMAM